MCYGMDRAGLSGPHFYHYVIHLKLYCASDYIPPTSIANIALLKTKQKTTLLKHRKHQHTLLYIFSVIVFFPLKYGCVVQCIVDHDTVL